MTGVKTLVTEYTTDLVNLLQSAHDQTFQIQLQRDTKLQILVQCVEVGLERSCSCSAGIGNQHRSLNLHEALSCKVLTDSADDFGTFDEGIFYFRVHDKIHISLTVTDIRIGQTVEFLRQNLQALGKKGNRGSVNGNLSGLRLKYLAFQSYDITDIHFLEIFVGIFPDTVPCHIGLNISL